PYMLSFYIGPAVLYLFLYDVLVVFLVVGMDWEWIASPHVPLGLYGAAVGVIVSVRNNSAYARWWEGRILWGAIVNNCRGLARQVLTTLEPVVPDSAAERAEIAAVQREFIYVIIAYVIALRQGLRQVEPWEDLGAVLTPDEIAPLKGVNNVALALNNRMGELAQRCQARKWITPMVWMAMDQNIDDLVDSQGGAERIKNTPLPRQYVFFPRLFVQIYCLMLPLGMVENLGWLTPLGSTLVGFMFLTLDKIGRELEDPFDNQLHDVPMTSITRTIEINLRQMLNEATIPAPVQPVDNVLW
ncbi:MAG TPA: bestrophin family ion channel, partial [Myxococcota bacterium]|nr:bestrophin family ion channel [Myxococcota bacterium]